MTRTNSEPNQSIKQRIRYKNRAEEKEQTVEVDDANAAPHNQRYIVTGHLKAANLRISNLFKIQLNTSSTTSINRTY